MLGSGTLEAVSVASDIFPPPNRFSRLHAEGATDTPRVYIALSSLYLNALKSLSKTFSCLVPSGYKELLE